MLTTLTFRRRMLLGALAALVLLLLFPRVASPAATMITFEEPIPLPQTVTRQYCTDPATNRGVEFLGRGARIITPPAASPPSSPTHALTNLFPGQEFGMEEQLRFAFTAPQSEVSVRVGLDRAHAFDVTARLWTFSSATPTPGAVLETDEVALGRGPTPINRLASVTVATATIRSAMVEFYGPGVGIFAFEVIDDLSFSTVGPPCVTDTANPTVVITQPPADGFVTHLPTLQLAFEATDAGSGVAQVEVRYLDALNNDLESFAFCGGPLTKPCGPPYGKVSDHIIAQLPAGTTHIRVVATDFTGRQGSADRSIAMQLPGPNANLWLEGIELTQATQTWVPTQLQTRRTVPQFTLGEPYNVPYSTPKPDGVPLVAERTTVARVYVGVEGTDGGVPVPNTTVKLRCFRDAAYTQPCQGTPELTTTITAAPGSLDDKRRLANRSANFLLPHAWTTGTPVGVGQVQSEIHLEAAVTAPLQAPECGGCDDLANRMRLRQVHFFATLQFRTIVDLIGVDRMVNNALTSLDTTQATTNLNFIRRVYPAVPGTVPLPAALPRATYTDDTTQSVDDRCAAVFDFAEGLQSGSWPIIAMVSGMPCRGAASLGGHHGYAVISDEEDTAHELGHALAIKHPGGFGPPSTEDPAVVAGHGDECASSCDDDWPWTHGLIGAYGFNTATMTPVVPGTAETDPHDFMSYGGGMMWISPRNWGRLFNYFGVFEHYFGRFESDTAVSGAADAVPGPAIALGLQDRVTARPSGQESGGRYLWVRGVFEERGGVTLKPFYELELTAAPRVRNGPYLIEALDSAGRVVATRSFEAERVHIDLVGGGARDLPPRFSEYLPLPEGARVASVVVRDERDVLATRARSAAAPEVTILSPTAAGFAGGRVAPAVKWTGADRDGDPLFYRVEYSPRPEPSVRGGRVWLPLATDLTGGDLAVALDGLPGGPDARVRVIATDGFNTTVEVSPDFFVADKPPAVEILAPEPGPLAVQIQAGERLMLRGVGSDLEDGDLSGAALTWRSNRDGQLGSGNVVEVSTLSLGIHTITLTGTDSRGEQASASVTVAVLPRLNTQPVAVAGPDQRVSMGATVRLDGSGSFDEDSDPLGYHWAIVGRPPQSDTPLRDPESARPSFTPDRPGVYTLELRVHDGALISLPDRVLVAVDAPLPALASPFPTPVATLVPVTPPPGMTITFPTPTATFAPVTRTPTAVVTPTVTATSPPVTRTPTPTVTPTPVCPPLGTPTLQAVPVGGNQVRVTWNVEGGCGRISGTITAQYTDQRAAFATHDVTATSGAVIDAPPTRCEGTFTVRYTLELRDAGGQRATATTVQSLLWLC